MDLLLPRSGSRLNKSQLPDESLKDSEPLLWAPFRNGFIFFETLQTSFIFFIFFRASFFIFFSEKKTGFILALEFPLEAAQQT